MTVDGVKQIVMALLGALIAVVAGACPPHGCSLN